MKTLKQKVRDTIVGRNTIEKMAQSIHYKNPQGRNYINMLAIDFMNIAKKRHPMFPYYLITRKI